MPNVNERREQVQYQTYKGRIVCGRILQSQLHQYYVCLEERSFTKRELVHLFCLKMLEKFMKHINNIKHQFSVTKQIKDELKANDILIHCNFSESYSCKLASEVQSLHFGGSRNQVSLHTVIKNFHDTSSNSTKKTYPSVPCLKTDAMLFLEYVPI